MQSELTSTLVEMRGLRERADKRISGLEDECWRWRERLLAAEERERQLRERLQWILDMSAGWDSLGSTGPRKPLSWESVGRMSLDYARAALAASPAPVESDCTLIPGERVRRCTDYPACACGQASAPVDSESKRTPEQYAIEHGRYLANEAREFCDTINELAEAEMHADEEADGDLQHQFQLQVEALEESRNECYARLQSCLYEFGKRADRAYPLAAKAQPQWEPQPDGLCLCPPNHCANKWIPGLDNPSCRGQEHKESGNG